MKILVLVELIFILLIVLISIIYKSYQKNKDKNKVKKVLNYLEDKTESIDVKKLEKILGIDDKV